MAFPAAPLPDGANIGDAGHTSDHNLIVAALAEVRASIVPSDAIVVGAARNGAPQRGQAQWMNATSGTAYFYPVYYGQSFGIDGFGFQVRNAAVGLSVSLGLYSSGSATWRPNALLAGTTIATDTAGWKSAGITAVTGLPVGWYWHACLATGATTDLFATGPLGFSFDEVGPNALEWAARWDTNLGRSLSITGQTSLPATAPTLNVENLSSPTVAVRFA